MRLLKAELQKLMSSKVLLVLLAVLLVVNFLLTLYLSQPQPWEKTVKSVYSDYIRNREPYENYLTELEQIITESMREEVPVLPYTFSGNPDYDDHQILRQVQKRNAYFEDYSQTIERVIQLTEIKIRDLHSYGYSDRTYTTKSQIVQKEQYETLLKTVELQNEYTSGYDTYLQNHIVCAFILIFLTAAVSYLFLHDGNVGFGTILQTTKRGRFPTAVAKLFAALIMSIVVTLLFLGTTFLAVGLAEGYSSPFNAIQAFEDFATVPCTMTVLEYLGLHVLLRLCAFAVYAMFIALLASLKLPYLFCFGGTAIFAGINGFLNYRTYYGTVPAIRYLNLSAMTEGCSLTDFFRTVAFFKIPVRMSTVLIIMCIFLCLLIGGVAAFFFSRNFRLFVNIGNHLSRLWVTFADRFWSFLFHVKMRICRPRQSPLWLFELQKMRPIVIFLMIALLLLARIWYVDQTIGDMERYEEALYYRYITEMQSMTEEERKSHLIGERDRIDTIITAYELNKTKFESGDMSGADYTAYLEIYHIARAEGIAFERVERYAQDLTERSNLVGINGDWIYTGGYEKLFGLPSDLFLYVALILLCFGSFSVEYVSNSSSGGFSQILRSTKKGRRNTFVVKLALYLILSVLLAIAFRLCDLWIVNQNYVMTKPQATLFSIQSFVGITTGITISEYFCIDLLLNAFSAVILASVICLLSCFLKKSFSVLTVSLLVTALPELLTKTVLTDFADCSILSFTAPQATVCRSFEQHWFEMNWMYLLIACTVYILVTVWFTYFAWRGFEGKQFSVMRKEKHHEA